MKLIPFSIEDNLYLIHIIDNTNYKYYKSILESVNICSTNFISNSYETLSYDALSEHGYIGCFVTNTDNSIIFSSLVINLECVDIKDKITNAELLEDDDAISISLLCSNINKRIPRLTYLFVQFVINKIIPLYKPNVKHILLYVAKGKENQQAISFYKKIGFEFVFNEHNIMILHINQTQHKGGTKKRKRQIKRRRRKTRKTYHNIF